jgi:hypothetical protein
MVYVHFGHQMDMNHAIGETHERHLVLPIQKGRALATTLIEDYEQA